MNLKQIYNNTLNRTNPEVNKNVAIHQAGLAAAIYFNNQQKALPPVFFQILITPLATDFQSSQYGRKSNHDHVVKVDGGRLIPILPSSIEEATSGFFSAQAQAYERAFEADMVNRLVGPLAEAKYIALRDGELMNSHLINVNALNFYGGTSDLEQVNEYLECFPLNQELKEQKITDLFLAAFNFVNIKSNWQAITALADYIVAEHKNVFAYEDIIRILENAHSLATFRSSRGYPVALNECV